MVVLIMCNYESLIIHGIFCSENFTQNHYQNGWSQDPNVLRVDDTSPALAQVRSSQAARDQSEAESS